MDVLQEMVSLGLCRPLAGSHGQRGGEDELCERGPGGKSDWVKGPRVGRHQALLGAQQGHSQEKTRCYLIWLKSIYKELVFVKPCY